MWEACVIVVLTKHAWTLLSRFLLLLEMNHNLASDLPPLSAASPRPPHSYALSFFLSHVIKNADKNDKNLPQNSQHLQSGLTRSRSASSGKQKSSSAALKELFLWKCLEAHRRRRSTKCVRSRCVCCVGRWPSSQLVADFFKKKKQKHDLSCCYFPQCHAVLCPAASNLDCKST